MFEVGALSKKIDKSKVCPILFNVEPSDIQGPLVQFQAAKFEKEEIKRVVRMMNVELGEKGLQSNVFDDVFEMWWPKLQEKVESELKTPRKQDKSSVRSERELLEEILELTRVTSLASERVRRIRGIDPRAIADMIEAFRHLIIGIRKFIPPKYLQRAVEEFKRPLLHIIRESDLPLSAMKEFDWLLDDVLLTREKKPFLHATEELDKGLNEIEEKDNK